jgi:oligopeptidase B
MDRATAALAHGCNLLAFRTNLDAGHAGAAGRFDHLREVALAYAFAIKVAGAGPRPGDSASAANEIFVP